MAKNSTQRRTSKHVFISWSGARSLAIAQAWYEIIVGMFHVKPFLSSSQIGAGTVWFDKLAESLETTDIGIVCLTPENLTAPWIHFESGAISKRVGRSRLCTYLFDLQASDLEAPLNAFNANVAGKDGTKQILAELNECWGRPIAEIDFGKAFGKWWPDFRVAISKVPPAEAPSEKLRNTRSLVQEALDLSRADTKMLAEIVRLLYDIKPRFPVVPDPKSNVHIKFEGGYLDGEKYEGGWILRQDISAVAPQNQVASIVLMTKGELGATIFKATEMSVSLTGWVTRETHQRLMREVPDMYGMQGYKIVERTEKDGTLLLTMRFIPQHEWPNRKAKPKAKSQPKGKRGSLK